MVKNTVDELIWHPTIVMTIHAFEIHGCNDALARHRMPPAAWRVIKKLLNW